jgi:hypothetical protein
MPTQQAIREQFRQDDYDTATQELLGKCDYVRDSITEYRRFHNPIIKRIILNELEYIKNNL